MAENSNLTLERRRLDQLQKARESAQSSQVPKIQRVAHHLRDRKHFTKHYLPRLISLGPIHYGSPKLQLGEHYKQMWASTYISTCTDETSTDISTCTDETSTETLHKKVTSHIKTIKDLFDTDLFSNNNHFSNYHNQGFRDMEEMICWTLFVDGCALLHILENAKLALHPPNKMNVKIDQLVLVMQDVLLLENQLPYPLLKLLWRNNDERILVETMKEFLTGHHWGTEEEDKVKIEIPSSIHHLHHLLHLQHTIFLYDPDQLGSLQIQIHDYKHMYNMCTTGQMVKYRNIRELKAAGIGLKSSKTPRLKDISFSNGWLCSELTLPEIAVDSTVLNLIAYEMYVNFHNDYGFSSYVSFLDSLIDHPDDVKALRSERILINSLGSDDEVAKLFNVIGSDSMPVMGKYARLRDEIESHYNSKCKTWVALAYHTYFNNPWAIIAFNAALLGLTLTFIQTWYAIYPSKNLR